MIPSGGLAQRLKTLIKTTASGLRGSKVQVYDTLFHPDKAILVELTPGGEAEVACAFPERCVCIHWRLPTGLFGFLLEDKNADGAFFIGQDANEMVEAHIIECKRTVDQKKWIDVTRQMRWTLSKLRALAGSLGLSISRVVLYTAFRTDNLSSEELPNPAGGRRPLGPPSEEEGPESELNEYRRMIRGWERDQVELSGFTGIFMHKKIQLDPDTGQGAVTFDCAL